MPARNTSVLPMAVGLVRVKATISTSISVDGMVIDSSVTTPMIGAPASALARKATSDTSDTTATDTGLAMMPIWLAIDEAAIGRSGRMPF